MKDLERKIQRRNSAKVRVDGGESSPEGGRGAGTGSPAPYGGRVSRTAAVAAAVAASASTAAVASAAVQAPSSAELNREDALSGPGGPSAAAEMAVEPGADSESAPSERWPLSAGLSETQSMRPGYWEGGDGPGVWPAASEDEWVAGTPSVAGHGGSLSQNHSDEDDCADARHCVAEAGGHGRHSDEDGPGLGESHGGGDDAAAKRRATSGGDEGGEGTEAASVGGGGGGGEGGKGSSPGGESHRAGRGGLDEGGSDGWRRQVTSCV